LYLAARMGLVRAATSGRPQAAQKATATAFSHEER
jgi:hypothetical protein